MARFEKTSGVEPRDEWEPDWQRIHQGQPYNGRTDEPLPRPRLASKWTPTRKDQYPNGIDFKSLPKGHSALPRWYLVMVPDDGKPGAYVEVWITGEARRRAQLGEYRRRSALAGPTPREQFEKSTTR